MRKVKVCEQSACGKIGTSLWAALEDQGVKPNVIDLIEDAPALGFRWFYHTERR
ncbi:MAG: hypothetical protein IPL08_17820 [Saprospiraceae bacterium]|nr:hypothetical protein [Saprospiraceae bacterium]